MRVGSRDRGVTARCGRLLCIVVVAAATAVLALPDAGSAASRPRVSASFYLRGTRLTVRGTVSPRGKARGGSLAARRVLLEQQVKSARNGRRTWATRASGRLATSRSAFSLVWRAPASTATLVVRLILRSGRRTLAISRVERLSVTPSPTGPGPPTKPVPGTTTEPTAGAQPCGGEVPPPKPGGGTWTCTFDDEFDAATGDATALNTSWWVPQVTATSGYTTGPLGNEACYLNSPNNVSVSGGALHLTVRKEAAPFDCAGLVTQYTAGMVSTYSKFSQAYGRFEVRALLPQSTATGLQETFWLWPVNDTLYGPWPASGEVDFSEFYSDYSDLDVPYIHYDYSPSTVDTATDTNTVTAYSCQITLSAYNDYAVVWTPGTFTITVNGNTCLTDNYLPDGGLTSPAPFSQPFFIALTQALGVNANAFDPATTPLPATTSIEYVRVWK